jgi:hypothetical protein
MSRFVETNEQSKEIAYGFDHATGYFFQVFDGVDEDGEDVVELDECSLFTGMSNGRMLELMQKYNVGTQEQRDKVTLDLPF